MKIAGLVLAAGRSSRMGTDKALLDYRGRSFLNHLTYLALPRVDQVIAVLGHHAEKIAETLPPSPRVRSVVNRDYDRGMLSSLQRGLAETDWADWVLWMLVDHPAVRGRTLDALLAAAERTEAPLVIPRWSGERGHPIVFSQVVARELLALASDCSPQDVVRSHYPQACFIDIEDRSVLVDVDRPADYRALAQHATD